MNMNKPHDETLKQGRNRSRQLVLECQDLVFQARILYRRNGKRILTDNQEKQESGKNDVKNVD